MGVSLDIMGKDEKAEILRDIKETGFPLEIEATSVLESKGWSVNNQDGYNDVDEDIWRPIDIAAFKSYDLQNSSYYRFHTTLVVECKRSSKPWVFWTRKKARERTFHPLMAIGLVKYASNPKLHPLHIEKVADKQHYFSSICENIGVIPFEAFTEAKSVNIFNATHQVTKALNFKLGEIKRMESTVEGIFCIFYPIIVLDGHLFEFRTDKDKKELVDSNYIQYLVSGVSPRAKELFLIDIVKKEFLADYLEIIEDDLKSFSNKIASIKSPSQRP